LTTYKILFKSENPDGVGSVIKIAKSLPLTEAVTESRSLVISPKGEVEKNLVIT